MGTQSYHFRKSNRDDMILAENIRYYSHAAKRSDSSLTFAEIARKANLHPSSFSRILAGSGTSEASLIAIANAIGISPGRFIARVGDIDKYPNIKPIRERTSTKPRYSTRPARSIEDLINNPQLASDFVGGAPSSIVPWLIESLRGIRQTCHQYRIGY